MAVCGCWSQALDENTARELGIDILAGSRGKNTLPDLVMNMLKEGRSFIDARKHGDWEWEELSVDAPLMHSRAFMKIQDGCNHFCTYCIIPYLRGRPASRPIHSILDEIHRLIGNGCKEVVFTGIHLGIYGQDNGTSLASLIRSVSKIGGLERLRLGSLEPFCLSDDKKHVWAYEVSTRQNKLFKLSRAEAVRVLSAAPDSLIFFKASYIE